MEKNDILSFLYFGYSPNIDYNYKNKNWAKVNKKAEDTSLKELITQGENYFQSSIDNCIEKKDYKKNHIVPLSGGLDSRAILGGLISSGLYENITTVTFGIPNTLDYEIGNNIAASIGTKHKNINLNNVSINESDLLNTIKEGKKWTPLMDAFYNNYICKLFGDDAVYWSGFMGDPLDGSHLFKQNSKTWKEALVKFCERNKFSKKVDLTPENYSPLDSLPNKPFLNNKNVLSFDEQLDFIVRQHCGIKSIVDNENYDYRFPFLEDKWVNFILSVPNKYRYNQFLYKKVLLSAYPNLFSMPTKNKLGLPLESSKIRLFFQKVKIAPTWFLSKIPFLNLNFINPNLNYLDFDNELRYNKKFQELVNKNLNDLKKRGIIDWLNISAIWNRHQNKSKNYSYAILTLFYLEMNLKLRTRHGGNNY